MSAAVAAIGVAVDPDPSWPVWNVELATRFGRFAGGDFWLMTAPDPDTAIHWVTETLAGTGLRASRNVRPALLNPDHPRFAATEAARRALTINRELEEVE